MRKHSAFIIVVVRKFAAPAQQLFSLIYLFQRAIASACSCRWVQVVLARSKAAATRERTSFVFSLMSSAVAFTKSSASRVKFPRFALTRSRAAAPFDISMVSKFASLVQSLLLRRLLRSDSPIVAVQRV